MGLTKSEIFTEKQNELAHIAKVLGHPARVAILQHLASLDACVCGDLAEEIGLAQPTISQHLKELKNLGIIKGTIEGSRCCYCIDPLVWSHVQSAMTQFMLDIQPKTSDCC